jgi:hypothetical protein
MHRGLAVILLLLAMASTGAQDQTPVPAELTGPTVHLAALPESVGAPDLPPVLPQEAEAPLIPLDPEEESSNPPFLYEIPFSLSDCIGILRAVLGGISVEDDAAVLHYEETSLRRALDSISNYLRARDDLHYNLVDYRWERVGIDTATSALIQPVRFTWAQSAMPQGVDAFSLEALRGDVYLHSMMIYDEKEEQVADFKFEGARLMRLRHSLPRREVFHLWRPTNVSRVDLAVSRFDPAAEEYPQIQLHAGRTSKPEHGKATIFFLTRADQEFASRRLLQAREDLQHALREMIAYNQVMKDRR